MVAVNTESLLGRVLGLARDDSSRTPSSAIPLSRVFRALATKNCNFFNSLQLTA